MCNRFVQWVLQVDDEKVFHFAPLNGVTSYSLLNGYVEPTSIVVVDSLGHPLREADAVLYLMGKLSLPWRLGIIGYCIPKFIRNGAYRWVAKRRHRFVRTSIQCSLPSESERKRFLK